MKSPLASSFAQQLEELRVTVDREWVWPSPATGFGLHVFHSSGEIPPFSEGSLAVAEGDTHRLDQAPILAAVGYALSMDGGEQDENLTLPYAQGLDRIAGRNPFPADRHSFVYRPIELLGVALAAIHCPAMTKSSVEWLRKVLRQAEEKLADGDLFQQLLGACAAHLLNVHWHPSTLLPLDEMNEYELALLIWLNVAYPEFATSHRLPCNDLETSLAQRCATSRVGTQDLAQASLLLFSLRRAIAHLVVESQSVRSLPTVQEPSPPRNLKGKVDFAIITVREDEHRAVLTRFPKNYIYRGNHRTYSVGQVALRGGGSYCVAVVKSIEQGESSGQDVARDVIEDLDPQWIVLVGIAGAVPASEFTLGDVVAAMRLHDFSVRALIEGRDPQYAISGGPAHKVVQDRLANLTAIEDELSGWNDEASIRAPRPPVDLKPSSFYGDASWKRKVRESLRRHFGPNVQQRGPLVTTGSIATSDSLMKDSQTLQQWQEAARQVLAVEMELGGVYHAARRANREYPVLAIRGISDIVGFKRHPDWTEYACNTSAAFARAFIETQPIEPINPNGYPI